MEIELPVPPEAPGLPSIVVELEAPVQSEYGMQKSVIGDDCPGPVATSVEHLRQRLDTRREGSSLWIIRRRVIGSVPA